MVKISTTQKNQFTENGKNLLDLALVNSPPRLESGIGGGGIVRVRSVANTRAGCRWAWCPAVRGCPVRVHPSGLDGRIKGSWDSVAERSRSAFCGI